MARTLNAKGLRINTSKEDALVVNGSTIINKDGEVQAVTIADKSITTGKLADKAVTSGKIADKAVELGKLAEAVQSAYVIKFIETGVNSTELVGVEEGDIVLRVASASTTVEPVATADTLPTKPDTADYLIIFRATA